MIRETRIKQIRFDYVRLFQMLWLSWRDTEPTTCIYKYLFPDLPDDARIVSVHHQYDPIRFTVFVSSKEFPEVPPGEFPPDVLGDKEYLIQVIPYLIPVVNERNEVVGYRRCFAGEEKMFDLLSPISLTQHNESSEPTIVRASE